MRKLDLGLCGFPRFYSVLYKLRTPSILGHYNGTPEVLADMRLPNVIILTLATIGVTEVSANFHISYMTSFLNAPTRYAACPSNQYNCNCFIGSTTPITTYVAPFGQFFQLDNGLCGQNYRMNFYLRSGGYYEFYKENGNGASLGKCYDNSGANSVKCVDYTVRDQLVCYSWICG
jgi:hypothetical protein